MAVVLASTGYALSAIEQLVVDDGLVGSTDDAGPVEPDGGDPATERAGAGCISEIDPMKVCRRAGRPSSGDTLEALARVLQLQVERRRPRVFTKVLIGELVELGRTRSR